MNPICIVAAKRTPQGRFLGALSKYNTLELGVAAGKAALANIDPDLVDLTIVGRVMPPDQNVARYIALELGIPEDRPGYTVNMVCASGMKAVSLAADAIALGQANVVLCGGAESMTNVPHGLEGSRRGKKLGDTVLVDYLVAGLSDLRLKKQMGEMVEALASKYEIDRGTQDAFALSSHLKAVDAQKQSAFGEEMIALPELDRDEHPRADTTLDKLASLKPAFNKDGTVTAGNASGINDGATMLVLCNEKTAQQHGWTPLAYYGVHDEVGVAPDHFGIGPATVTKKLCDKHNLRLNDFDTIEINEAFACQTIACLRDLGLPDNEKRLNLEGGAVALGHPVGASGARIIAHLAHRIHRGDSKQTIASLCVGGGMGIGAVISEKPA